MADAYLLETGVDRLLLEDGTSLLLLETSGYPTVVLSDSPSVYYRMGEASGAVIDTMGGLDGTAAGTVTRDVTGSVVDDDGAILFDGSTGKVTVLNHSGLTLGDGPLTIEFWVKITTLTGVEAKIIDKGVSNAYQVTTNGSGGFTFSKSGVAAIAHSSVAVSAGGSHHVVVTKNGATSLVYVDGVDVTALDANQTLADDTGNLVIGANRGGASDFFPGTIDEVAIYKSVLSPARVLAHYVAGSPGTAIQPAAVTITVTGPAPSLSIALVPAPATITITGPAPKLSIGLVPAAVTITINGPAPSLTTGTIIQPAAVTIVVSGPAPSLSSVLVPAALTVTVNGPAPSVSLGVKPAALTVAVNGPAPSISLGVKPAALTVTVNGPVPSLAVGLVPAALTITVNGPAPSLSFGINPAAVTVTINGPAPSLVVGSSSVTLTPAAVTVVISGPAPSLVIGVRFAGDALGSQAFARLPQRRNGLTGRW